MSKDDGLADPRLGKRFLAEARLRRYELKIERSIKAALRRQKTHALSALRTQTITAAAPPDAFDLAAWDTAVTDEVLPVIDDVMTDIATKVTNFLALPPETRAKILGQIDLSARVDSFASKVTSIGPNIASRVIDELTVGVGKGESIDNLTERLTTCFDVADNDATRIARTETHGASQEVQHVSAQAISNAGYTVTKTWLATADDRTRQDHIDADGQEVGIDDTFTVGDDELRYPGDENGSPQQVVNCRCSVVYSMPEDKDPDAPDLSDDAVETQSD